MKLFSHLSANSINLNPMPFLRELSMEAYLIENQNVLSLTDEDLDQVQIIDYELPVRKGRSKKNTDGRIDLLTLFSNETIGIVELKNCMLVEENFEQLQDYFLCKEEIFEKHKEAVSCEYKDSKWIGVLVGTDIDSKLLEKITDGSLKIDNVIPVAAIIINRYRSDDGQIFISTDTYFKNNQRNMDRSKYKFNNMNLGKGRLSYEIVKKYILDHSNITYNELEEIFPKSIQGNHGVFTTLENAQDIYSRYGYKRHFLNEEDILFVGNVKIAICSQWGIGNIDNIIKLAKEKLKYSIEHIK